MNSGLKLSRDRTAAALYRIRSQVALPTKFDPAVIEQFGRDMRENIMSGAVPFRKAYIQAAVDGIEVDDGVVRVTGEKSTLEQAIVGDIAVSGGVRRSVPKWRTRRDSNPWPLPSEQFSLPILNTR